MAETLKVILMQNFWQKQSDYDFFKGVAEEDASMKVSESEN